MLEIDLRGRQRAVRDATSARATSHADALGGLARLAYEDLAAPTRRAAARDPLVEVRVLFASPPVVVIGAESLAQPRARTVAEDDLERDRRARAMCPAWYRAAVDQHSRRVCIPVRSAQPHKRRHKHRPPASGTLLASASTSPDEPIPALNCRGATAPPPRR